MEVLVGHVMCQLQILLSTCLPAAVPHLAHNLELESEALISGASSSKILAHQRGFFLVRKSQYLELLQLLSAGVALFASKIGMCPLMRYAKITKD